jgi:hypothetical protein
MKIERVRDRREASGAVGISTNNAESLCMDDLPQELRQTGTFQVRLMSTPLNDEPVTVHVNRLRQIISGWWRFAMPAMPPIADM